jgi:hypothetical protein
MTLEESTAWALAAVQAGDLDDLARAICARRDAIAEAIASGQPPPPHVVAEVVAAGDELCTALENLKRELKLESARLQRIQEGFSSGQPRVTHISLRG